MEAAAGIKLVERTGTLPSPEPYQTLSRRKRIQLRRHFIDSHCNAILLFSRVAETEIARLFVEAFLSSNQQDIRRLGDVIQQARFSGIVVGIQRWTQPRLVGDTLRHPIEVSAQINPEEDRSIIAFEVRNVSLLEMLRGSLILIIQKAFVYFHSLVRERRVRVALFIEEELLGHIDIRRHERRKPCQARQAIRALQRGLNRGRLRDHEPEPESRESKILRQPPGHMYSIRVFLVGIKSERADEFVFALNL